MGGGIAPPDRSPIGLCIRTPIKAWAGHSPPPDRGPIGPCIRTPIRAWEGIAPHKMPNNNAKTHAHAENPLPLWLARWLPMGANACELMHCL